MISCYRTEWQKSVLQGRSWFSDMIYHICMIFTGNLYAHAILNDTCEVAKTTILLWKAVGEASTANIF